LNREAIIANLRGIWEALCGGDAAESQVGSFIYMAFKQLDSYWNGTQFTSARPQIDPIDEVEFFLSRVANFD
jgi:hypothetical protein